MFDMQAKREIRPRPLGQTGVAFLCSYARSFCYCTETRAGVCPNRGGAVVARPLRHSAE